MPVGAAATLLVVVGIVVGQNERSGRPGRATPADRDQAATRRRSSAEPAGGEKTAPQGSNETAADRATFPAPAPDADRIARGTDERIVDATARITLGAEADACRRSPTRWSGSPTATTASCSAPQVTTDAGGARAAFELEIPYKRLDAALTDLSGLADVISRTEAGQDITARAVRAQKDLAATYERIRRARIELIRADTTEERLVIESRISALEATAEAERAELNGVKRQGRFATVNVDITSSGSDADQGGWSLGEALDDAGRVLEVIGGIALVSLAVLVPVACVGALAWLIATRVRHRRRERALDE